MPKKKKMFVKLKGGDWFRYRSALYLKIGPLTVCKMSRKYCKLNVNLSSSTKVDVHSADFHFKSLVTPIKADIYV
jgi:hypothetical protein